MKYKVIPQKGKMLSKITSMCGVGNVMESDEWFKYLGQNNFDLAIASGVLCEHEKSFDAMVDISNIMNNGDYVVYSSQKDGCVMYHKSDGKIWRTTSPDTEQFTAEKSVPVEGIDPKEANLPVIKEYKGTKIGPDVVQYEVDQINFEKDDEDE